MRTAVVIGALDQKLHQSCTPKKLQSVLKKKKAHARQIPVDSTVREILSS